MELISDSSIRVIKLADISKLSNPSAEGDVVVYTITVENNGNTTVTDVLVNDPLLGGDITESCNFPSGGYTLLPSEVSVCVGNYILTQDDVDNGYVENSALASGRDPNEDDVTDISDPDEEEVETPTADGSVDGDPTNDPTVITLFPCVKGEIGNKVWLDIDEDGDEDDDESGIEGITVKLKDFKGNTLDKDNTDDDGRYLFEDLAPGEYIIVVDKDDIEDFTQTYDPKGAVINNKARVSLSCDEVVTKIDFGFTEGDVNNDDIPTVLAKTGGEKIFVALTGFLKQFLMFL